MNIYVYSANPSNGARDLTHALDAIRLRTFDGMDFWRKGKRLSLKEGDVLICWGTPVPEMEGIRILNAGSKITKRDELKKLYNAGIPCPAPRDYMIGFNTSNYIGRRNNHVGGSDILGGGTHFDFLVPKFNVTEEYRIHSFLGKSIKAGKKVVRDGFTLATSVEQWQSDPSKYAHPWVRSFDAGWRIRYDEFRASTAMRQLARKAVGALDLNFGAVDLGLASVGLVVFEVNRAPGADPPTIETYTKAIKKWIENPKAEVEEAPAAVEPAPTAPPANWDQENAINSNIFSYNGTLQGSWESDILGTTPTPTVTAQTATRPPVVPRAARPRPIFAAGAAARAAEAVSRERLQREMERLMERANRGPRS